MATKPAIDDDFPAEPDYPQFAPGTRVRDCYGRDHVVSRQSGCAVFTTDGKHFHPTKAFAVR